MDADERNERLEQLFRQTFRRVMAYCLRRTGETAAHDAVAEVYVVAWRRRRHLPDDGEEAVLWLLGIARRVLANQARSQRRWSRLLLRVAEQPDPPQPRQHRDDAGDELEAALAQASAADRELLRLAYWDDLSRHEIATVLGISVGAVDTRLHRAKQRLRERLAASSSEVPATKEKDHAER
ncbi:RNA polymerase sigma factor [Streptomyces sp. GESEQ-35]|uniref:RNA polymerase sigma factor n=1 Tax=Streptomyces sp. GESEQ-35 TaxID=2812657 RepID=UPI001B33F591|nr:sigma-70 family RNA polymerase sigma factor [Streptomyces sp. GESEQ-35]